jgi:hypothetical protein
MPGMGGGSSGGGGGVVVGGPTPQASGLAGMYQLQAAQAAANAAKEQTNSAINYLRQQYTNAFTTLKPYTQEGIQALNELNAYMGLRAYDPGTGPRAPEMPTLESLAGKATRQDVIDYINQNVMPVKSGGATRWKYVGEGMNDPALLGDWTKKGIKQKGTYSSTIGSVIGGVPAYEFLGYQADVSPFAKQGIAKERLPGAMDEYNANMDIYNQQKDVYDYAKNMQAQYAGPYTPEEVQAKLMAQPGVQFQYQQGLDAIQRAASAKGMLNSGRLLQSLADYGQGLASQQYGETLSRLAGLAGMGQASATGQASAFGQLGQGVAGLKQGLGDTLANSYLAGGNALAQSYLAGHQQYQVIGGGGGGGGGMGGIGQALGAVGSIAGLFAKCSRTLKDKVNTPSKSEILNSVKNLNIDVWKYKGIDGNHIGPYAEEFRDHFNVGDGKTINIIDALGVLFASVQELSAKLDSIKKEA